MKKTYWKLTAALLVLLVPWAAWGQQPPLGVTLTLSGGNSGYYTSGESVGATVTLTNISGGGLLVNKGLGTKEYYLSMRVIDPSGRLILSSTGVTPEQPDPTQLPVIIYQGRRIQAAECEYLSQEWSRTSQTADLGASYSLALPGYYSVQAQIDAAVFQGLPCDLNAHQWQGVLKSDTLYFFYEGKTPVTFGLQSWPTAWGTDPRYQNETLTVTITPDQGSVSDYDLASLRLNNVPAASTPQISGGSVLASFNKKQAFLSLGEVQSGLSYPARVTGTLKTGGFFGGARLVTVTAPYGCGGFSSPVDNPPTINSAKAGAAIPVKWRLTDAAGAPVSDPASFVNFSSYAVDCGTYTGSPTSAVEEYASGASGLQYLGDGYWQYNWKTSSTYAGKCRTLVVTLKDGSTYNANFKFK